MSERGCKQIRFRYRGYLTLIDYYNDGRVVARTLKTYGNVHVIEEYWPVVLMDQLCEKLDRFIADQDFDILELI